MAAEEENTSRTFLPFDIIECILLKLPSKSLLRFKTVSKSWRSTISDPNFAKIHPQFPNPPNLFLLKRSIDQGFYLVKLHGKEVREEAVLESPNGWNNALCCCNGVLLLTSTYWVHWWSREYFLWNPSTRMKTDFSFPPDFGYSGSINLGILATADDFKVVITCKEKYAVFSCKSNSWTEKLGFPYHGSVPGISVDGAVYWVLRDEKNTKQVVCFDSETDELRTLPKPDRISDDCLFQLACLKGGLCFYCKIGDGTAVRIWIKEEGVFENCWKELITVEDLEDIPIRSIEPLCFVENKIVLRLEFTRFVCYDPCDKTFEEFEDTHLFGIELFPFMDTLFFPVMKTSNKRKRSYLSGFW
ncbi:hypothetical protein MIMGU_mgv1a008945mg [Erythranthe guttata]|uniref:F-box domain-containing protein n=1 Tax=Erythranthe guttata TaxID=4155 RepID=A0A022QXM0_ERYGU|nr:hypothetical protein MIMGU_mgv1a008945mg [Erythranthe guttata]